MTFLIVIILKLKRTRTISCKHKRYKHMTNRNTLSQPDNVQLYPMHYKYTKLAYKRPQIGTNHFVVIILTTNRLRKYFYTFANHAIFQGQKIRHYLQNGR